MLSQRLGWKRDSATGLYALEPKFSQGRRALPDQSVQSLPPYFTEEKTVSEELESDNQLMAEGE